MTTIDPGTTAAYTPPPPGSDRDALPKHLRHLVASQMRPYLSTACETAAACKAAAELFPQHADELHAWEQREHAACRQTRKQEMARCICRCHRDKARERPEMSVVTSTVIACPSDWSMEQAQHFGRVLYHASEKCRYPDREIAPDDGYFPISDEVASGKVPSGHHFWIGLNHVDMDEVLANLDADPQCHGAWVWYQPEGFEPRTHLVGVS